MSIKILLADDSITIQKVIGIIFGGEEYSLTVVDNGKAAVEKAIEIVPDILLIDALMPGISGYEVCEQIRATPALAAKPILLLTGSFEPFDEAKAKNCGADDYIAKPFESQQIISKVTELYEKSASSVFETAQDETILSETPPPLPEETKVTEKVETAAEPQDIWEAFTPPEPPVETPASLDETIDEESGTLTEETDESIWSPTEEQATADMPIEPAEETSHGIEPAFGEVTFEETTISEELSDEPVIAAEAAPPTQAAEIIQTAEETATAPVTLSEEQLRAAIAGVSKDVIERIVWEVVPDLAETLIKEAIRRIKEGQ